MFEEKKVRKAFSKLFNQRPWKGIPSLMDEERIGNATEDGEYFSLFGFIPEKFNKYSDEEIQELLDECMREEIRSPYDCTGKRFTMWIDFHRNPCGRISYVHRMGIDV